MNKNKTALLVLIVGIVALTAYFVGQQFIGAKSMKPVEVEATRAISSIIVEPQDNIFNDAAINPTVPIIIGENNQIPIGN